MLDTLVSFVTVLLALSVAAERLVELFKGFFPQSLNGPRAAESDEASRQLKIHWMSLIASCVVVFLLKDYITATLKLDGLNLLQGAAFAILASGGSSMWNSILTYLLSAKNMKRQDEVAGQKTDNRDLAGALPAAMPAL